MKIREFSRAYTTRNNKIALLNTLGTLAAYFTCLWLALTYMDTWYLVAPLVVLVAAFGVRLYMVQHDCGHGSFYTSRRVNNFVGRCLAPLTFTPYAAARHNHNEHHAFIGNLDRRDAGEIFTMTVQEYCTAPLWKRIGYRIYRHPVTLFLVGPAVMFLLFYRLPKNGIKIGVWDVIINNLVIVALFYSLFYLFGIKGMAVMVACVVMAGLMGAFIPYVQHNFENMYWEHHPDVRFEEAALQSSAVLDFGPVYDFMTLNIAYHDLHHLNANIPSYNLKKCHGDMAHLLNSERIGFIRALGCLRLKLWDEAGNKMVGFPPIGARFSVLREGSVRE